MPSCFFLLQFFVDSVKQFRTCLGISVRNHVALYLPRPDTVDHFPDFILKSVNCFCISVCFHTISAAVKKKGFLCHMRARNHNPSSRSAEYQPFLQRRPETCGHHRRKFRILQHNMFRLIDPCLRRIYGDIRTTESIPEKACQKFKRIYGQIQRSTPLRVQD